MSGTSRVVPSNATSRRRRYHAPFVLRVASGRATSMNSSRSGTGPSLARARAIDILWYQQPVDLDGITHLVGTWFQDYIAPRLAGPETVVPGRVVVNTTPPHTATTLPILCSGVTRLGHPSDDRRA
jgi:hypothetical protein